MTDDEWDMTMIDQIRELDDADGSLLKDIIATYLNDAPKRLEAARAACAADDLDGLHRAAHTLKGASSNLGLNVMVHAAANLVADVRAEKTDNLDNLMAALEAAWTRSQELLATL